MKTGFESLALSPALVAVTQELGYVAMTPIQAKGIPVLLAGKDLIGQAKTGSGKTAAFALPMLQVLSLDQRKLQALILVPTRELCAQVAREIRKLGSKHAGLHVVIISGGQPARFQATALEGGAHIAVGTPGRVLDLMRRRALDLESVTMAVLDEADRMLDMGFADEMNQILGALPRQRQTAFFSATFPDTIEAMSRRHQRSAVRVTIDDPVEKAPDIRQCALSVEQSEKLGALYRILAENPHESALIFCAMKATVSELTATLDAAGVSADCLHGDLEQFERDSVMAMFRNQSVRVLVATDVAARGLDVADLDLVINYDMPSKPDVYIHRIGRTGRAGNVGLAVSLVTAADERKLAAIEERIGRSVQRLPRNSSGYRNTDALSKSVALKSKMDTIQLECGRKDKVRPGDILGALTGEAGGLDGSDIGKIEIHDRRAFVAVASAVSRKAVESLTHGRIKGRRFRASLVARYRG